MKRRSFTQMLAAGAGSLALTGGDNTEAAQQQVEEAGKTPGSDAVCITDFMALAEKKLPKPTYDYITTGSEDQLTLQENVTAFQRVRLNPPLLHGVSQVDLSTTVLNQKISLPVMIAPVAALRMYHEQGALAAARAAESAGTILGLSTSAGNSVEEVGRATRGPKWFQLYVPKDRDVTRRLVERVETAGFTAMVVTVDLGERKDADRRNQFRLPKAMLLKHLRDVGHTQLNDSLTYEQLLAFNDSAWDLSLSWDFFDWLKGVTKLPLLIKGVLRPEDAREAVARGVNGIIVSNHGGRRLDGVPASIDAVEQIAKTVKGRADVLMDGGVRRGSDVLKAIALGAKAVLIGRPYAWALSAAGEPGVRHCLTLLGEELTNAMVACGCRNIAAINRSLLV